MCVCVGACLAFRTIKEVLHNYSGPTLGGKLEREKKQQLPARHGLSSSNKRILLVQQFDYYVSLEILFLVDRFDRSWTGAR